MILIGLHVIVLFPIPQLLPLLPGGKNMYHLHTVKATTITTTDTIVTVITTETTTELTTTDGEGMIIIVIIIKVQRHHFN